MATIKLSRSQWEFIGKQARWLNPTDAPGAGDVGGYPGIPYEEYRHLEKDGDEIGYQEYLENFDYARRKIEDLKEDDIKKTVELFRQGTPIEQIDTNIAKDFVHGGVREDIKADYDFRKEESVREWASDMDFKKTPEVQTMLKDLYLDEEDVADEVPYSFDEWVVRHQ